MTAKKAKPRKKTPGKTPARKRARKKKAPNLVPQLHGGAINQGRPANPRAGPGRPRAATRDAMHLAVAERIDVLTAIADGDVVQRIAVPLAAVLEHARCPKCAGHLKPNDAMDLLVGIEGRVSASPRDRTGAMKLMAEVGIGPMKEISIDVIREKLREQNALIRRELDPAVANSLLTLLGKVWKGDK